MAVIITVFASFQIHFVKYIQVTGVLYGYSKFDYVDQCVKQTFVLMKWNLNITVMQFPGGGGALPYMGYIGMCRCEGYGFQAVYSRIGYINQSVWV